MKAYFKSFSFAVMIFFCCYCTNGSQMNRDKDSNSSAENNSHTSGKSAVDDEGMTYSEYYNSSPLAGASAEMEAGSYYNSRGEKVIVTLKELRFFIDKFPVNYFLIIDNFESCLGDFDGIQLIDQGKSLEQSFTNAHYGNLNADELLDRKFKEKRLHESHKIKLEIPDESEKLELRIELIWFKKPVTLEKYFANHSSDGLIRKINYLTSCNKCFEQLTLNEEMRKKLHPFDLRKIITSDRNLFISYEYGGYITEKQRATAIDQLNVVSNCMINSINSYYVQETTKSK